MLAALLLTSCGPANELNRPDPIDLSKLSPGSTRMVVMGQLGPPVSTISDNGNSCDVYQLYTSGPSAAGKGAIAFVEGASDIVTLGLAEVLFTPIEATTSSAKHTVLACYDKDQHLVEVRDATQAAGK